MDEKLAAFLLVLRAARLERGFSQRWVGEQLGVHQNRVSMWESGKHTVQDERLRRWARFLGVPVPDGVSGRLPPACGTIGGAQRHRRLGEAPCARCRGAWNAYQAAWKGQQP